MGLVLLSGIVTYAAVLAYTRIVGLRSFAKLSAADFAMTVAVGLLFAATVSAPDPSLTIGLVALGTVFAVQFLVSFLRERLKGFSKLVDNEPLLLMAGNTILDEYLRRVHVTWADIIRQAPRSQRHQRRSDSRRGV